jgi:hypothetical protein
MSKGVKRLVPAGKRAVKGLRVTSLKHARKVTSAYHALLYAKSKSAAEPARLRQLDGEIAAMGGLETYQAASALSTAAFRSSRWIFKTLTHFGLQPSKGALPLRVLELGATNAQLAVCPWLRVRAIDLMSHHPAIEAKDFFDVPVGSGPTGQAAADVAPGAVAASSSSSSSSHSRDHVWGATPSRLKHTPWDGAAALVASDYSAPQHVPGVGATATLLSRSPASASASAAAAAAPAPTTGCYDIVVNNLVLNCVGAPQDRVRMLVQCRDHLVPGGLLFFAVPSRCLDASAYTSRRTVEGLLAALGFVQRAYKQTPKISFYLFQRVDTVPAHHVAQPAPAAASAAQQQQQQQPLLVAPAPLHGQGWRPRIIASSAKEEAWLLAALRHPPAKLKENSGLTEFSLSLDPSWVSRSRG